MPKQIFKTLELTTLLVALDHLEEYGPPAALADLYAAPGEGVYLKYVPDAHAAALAGRLPHARVAFKVPGTRGRSREVRHVFNRAAVLHLLKFCFPDEPDFGPYLRTLSSVGEKYWKVLDADGEPIPRPKRGKA